MRLSDERYEQIKEIIVNMFEKYRITCVPISGFEIASKMGILVVPYSAYKQATQLLLLKESDDGFFLEKEDGSKFIFYNDEKGYGRINNTMLHEIGHYVLEHTQESELAETEVKFFAKYALVPPILIDRYEIDNPIDIMDKFDVSLEAALYALEYHNKWKSANKENRPYEKKLLKLFDLQNSGGDDN